MNNVGELAGVLQKETPTSKLSGSKPQAHNSAAGLVDGRRVSAWEVLPWDSFLLLHGNTKDPSAGSQGGGTVFVTKSKVSIIKQLANIYCVQYDANCYDRK